MKNLMCDIILIKYQYFCFHYQEQNYVKVGEGRDSSQIFSFLIVCIHIYINYYDIYPYDRYTTPACSTLNPSSPPYTTLPLPPIPVEDNNWPPTLAPSEKRAPAPSPHVETII
jgi:hypothetical protein